MAFYSKYTGKELEEKLDIVNGIPEYVTKVIEAKGIITVEELEEILKDYAPTDYSNLPIDNITIYWDNGTLKATTAVEDKTFYYEQPIASSEWVINHNMNKYPSVMVFDSANDEVHGDIRYSSKDQIIITFSAPFTGVALLN